jgi:hypothetical protein
MAPIVESWHTNNLKNNWNRPAQQGGNTPTDPIFLKEIYAR